MDIVASLGWTVVTILGALWSFVWFLIAGWIATLLQITLLISAIYFLKYGWRRAPVEILKRCRAVGDFFWSWLRLREPQANTNKEVRTIVRIVRTKEFGDVNISTLLSLLVLIGLTIFALAARVQSL